jgi:hypothetical protein
LKNNLIILTIVFFSAFLLCGAASAATVNSTTSKVVSTAQVKDLIVTQVTAPTKGVKGHTITVSNTIKNQGNAATTGFYVNYYLKKSSASSNIYIGKRYITSLGAGASNHQNTKLKLPTSIKSANYFIIAYADSTKLVKESIETNNAKYSPTKINVQSPKRDLIVTEVTARLWGLKGKTIIVSNTIKNQENSATTGFWVNYYLKKSKTSSNIYIGHRYITSLGSGASNHQNTKLIVPAGISSTSYYIRAYADSTKLIKETIETNNVKYSPTKMNIRSVADKTPVYITSDNIINTATDNARINNLVVGLASKGVYAVNYALGPNSHYSVLKDANVPQNALIIDIYGGACAGTIWEMTKSYYKNYRSSRTVYSIWINTKTDISTLSFLARAHDDDFTPLYGSGKSGAFPNFVDTNNDGVFEPGAGYVNGKIYPTKLTEKDGIAYPAQLLLTNGYKFLYQQNGDISILVNKILEQAKLKS